jgi:GTP pyrophosphokinase
MSTAAPAEFKEWSGYLKPEDISQLQSAYHFSEQAHEGQFRKSGEPYISHPLAVANILAQWHLDTQALTAALLHDVMEDTSVTKTEISRNFGKPVAELVDGVSKLDKIEFESHAEAQAENFRKMLLAMARDVRVILIKLADRLHNMRTLEAVSSEQKRRIARETLEIYAPIANRLGLNSIRQELEDLALKHLYPDRYRVLAKAVKAAGGNRREVVGKVLDGIRKKLKSAGVEALAQGREKHLYSIYRKMREKHLTFAQVQDVYGFRIIVNNVQGCYLALGALHSLYKPIPGKFKDYVAIPKANGYQSLHTMLFGPFGTPIEVQIRTHEMHKIAEAGVASHWLYKDSDTSLSELQKKTHQWLQSLLEMQSQSGDSVEFLARVKDLPGRGLRVHAQGQDPVAAARGDRGGLCLRRAHRHRQPVRGGEDQPGADAVEDRAEERRPGRDHHRGARQAQRALAQLRGDRQGALAHSSLPEDHALP